MNHYPSHTYQGYYPSPYAGTAIGSIDASRALAAGATGFIVGGSAALGVNLHKVRANQMTLNEALIDSLAKGAGGRGCYRDRLSCRLSGRWNGTGKIRHHVRHGYRSGLLTELHRQTGGECGGLFDKKDHIGNASIPRDEEKRHVRYTIRLSGC